jgi:hypothetical protein
VSFRPQNSKASFIGTASSVIFSHDAVRSRTASYRTNGSARHRRNVHQTYKKTDEIESPVAMHIALEDQDRRTRRCSVLLYCRPILKEFTSLHSHRRPYDLKTKTVLIILIPYALMNAPLKVIAFVSEISHDHCCAQVY